MLIIYKGCDVRYSWELMSTVYNYFNRNGIYPMNTIRTIRAVNEAQSMDSASL